MKLSEQAWQKSVSVINAATSHPFNQEMARGTLAHNRFSYYIEDSDRFCKRLGSLLYTTRLFSTVLLLLIY